MQGFILHSHRARDEDLIAYILTPNSLCKSYRFYGARHSSILPGFKIDFELIENSKFLPHLRSVIHLGFSWLHDRARLIIWQQFMRLLYEHLKGVETLDDVYFNELDSCALKLTKQNPKRLMIEAYIKILAHEGRLHSELECFACDGEIRGEVVLTRGFLPAHKECVNAKCFLIDDIRRLFETHSSMHLDDNDINELYQILLLGA